MTTEIRRTDTDGGGGDARADSKEKPTLLDQMGGPVGAVYSGLPVMVFVVANSVLGLNIAIAIAVGFALALTVFRRVVRKEPLSAALSGLLGVGIASFVAYKTGSAKGFFLIGIWVSLALACVFLISVLVRWPLVGLALNAVTGKGHAWRADKRSLRAFDIATLALTAVFVARFVVQQWLYAVDDTGWLAVAKIAMGYPLYGLALLVILWAARYSSKRLKALSRQRPAETA